MNMDMESYLRSARPLMGIYGYPEPGNRNKVVFAAPCEVPASVWMQAFAHAGFDPNGACGPTYYRVPADGRHYYSTIIHPRLQVPFLIMLIIPSSSRETAEANPVIVAE